MKKSITSMAVLLFSAVLCFSELAAQSSDLEAPRAPKRERITKLEQVLPNEHWLIPPTIWVFVEAQEMGVTTDVVARDVASVESHGPKRVGLRAS